MNGFAALDIHPHRRYVVDIGGRRSSRCRLHINFALFLHSLDFTQNLGVTRPIAQNVAAFDFSKLLQKRDGLVTISAVASRYRQADRYSLPIDQGMNLCVLSSTGPSNTDVPLHRFLGPRLACSDTLLVVESTFSSSSSAFAPSA